jgi:hypothetical protein
VRTFHGCGSPCSIETIYLWKCPMTN